MNIIITGASRGIGRATALALSEDRNNRILITGRNESLLREVSDMAVSGNISYYVSDFLGGVDQVKLLSHHISSVFSIVDILINNAGYLLNKEFRNLTETEYVDMAKVNYITPALLVKELLPRMRRGSHIVNISSMGGFQGSSKFKGLAGYSASKAGLASLTECLATELIEEGIKVNCLALGSVQTEMIAEAFPGYKAPMGPEEMAKFISWFSVNGGSFFNGRILPVAVTNP